MGIALSSIVLLQSAIVLILAVAWGYFRRVRVQRPPVGVFNLRDVLFTFTVLVVLPPLYLELPTWLVASILVLMATGLAYLTVSSAFGRPVAFTVAGGLAVAEVALIAWGYGQSTGFMVLNDVAVGVLVVGVCNIWAQSGIHARDVAVFGCAVAGYDLVATWLMPLMTEFFTRVRALPFAPMLATGTGTIIGMGDLLFVVLWPLVCRKAFTRRAGLQAAAATVGCVVAMGAAFATGLLTGAVPAMLCIGPVILAQYLWFRRRYRTERTTGQYEAATRGTPLPAPPVPPVGDIAAALTHLPGGEAPYLAIHHGTVIASGPNPGAATIAARKADPTATPVLVLTPNTTRLPEVSRAGSLG